MNKGLFQQYSDIKKQIKELEAKADELSPQLLSAMVESQVEKVESDFGTFSITTRKTWSYSDAVKESEKATKQLKAAEEENGTATFKETKSLRYDLPKNNQ